MARVISSSFTIASTPNMIEAVPISWPLRMQIAAKAAAVKTSRRGPALLTRNQLTGDPTFLIIIKLEVRADRVREPGEWVFVMIDRLTSMWERTSYGVSWRSCTVTRCEMRRVMVSLTPELLVSRT